MRRLRNRSLIGKWRFTEMRLRDKSGDFRLRVDSTFKAQKW
jgi:hypothetical protein